MIPLIIEGLFKLEMPVRVCDSFKLDNKCEVRYDFYVLPMDKSWEKYDYGESQTNTWDTLSKEEKINHHRKKIEYKIKSSYNSLISMGFSIKYKGGVVEDISFLDVSLLYHTFLHKNKTGIFKILFVVNKFELLTPRKVRESKLDLILS